MAIMLVLTNRNRDSVKDISADYVLGPFDTEQQAMQRYAEIEYLLPDPGPWWYPSTLPVIEPTPTAFRAALVADHEPDELEIPENDRYIPALKPERASSA